MYRSRRLQEARKRSKSARANICGTQTTLNRTRRTVNRRVVRLRLNNEFERVGDEVARRQRIAHSGRALRHSIADADGSMPQPDEAFERATLLDFLAEVVEVVVARIALVPHAADTDLRLVHVFLLETSGEEHSLCASICCILGKVAGMAIQDRFVVRAGLLDGVAARVQCQYASR